MDIFYKNSFRKNCINPLNDRSKTSRQIIHDVCTSHFGLITFLVLYTFVGASIFQAVERNRNIYNYPTADVYETKDNITEAVEAWLNRLVDSETLVVLNAERLKQEIKSTWKSEVLRETPIDYHHGDIWSFGDAWDFCMAILTTVGYGNHCPVTVFGKGLMIIYAIIGVPFYFITVLDIAICWSKGVGKIVKTIKLKQESYGEFSKDNQAKNTHVCISVLVAFSITIIYIVLGALLFTTLEKWSYLDSVYFVCVSLSSIGFGDLIPERRNFIVLYWIYVVLGMIMVVMNIVLIAKSVMTNIKTEPEKEVTKGDQV